MVYIVSHLVYKERNSFFFFSWRKKMGQANVKASGSCYIRTHAKQKQKKCCAISIKGYNTPKRREEFFIYFFFWYLLELDQCTEPSRGHHRLLQKRKTLKMPLPECYHSIHGPLLLFFPQQFRFQPGQQQHTHKKKNPYNPYI